MLSAFGELKPISRIDRDDVGCEGTGFVGIGRVMQVMMVTMVILVVLMVIMLTVIMMMFIVMMTMLVMLVARELDLEGLGGLCRLVGEDWLDDNDDDMMMWAGIETLVVIKF